MIDNTREKITMRKRIIKNIIETMADGPIHYILRNGGKQTFKPWLGDLFSFSYDYFMEKKIFPGKFGGDIHIHIQTLKQILENIHGTRVLELGAGTGSAARFLPNDNEYVGIDTSRALLKRAAIKFYTAGFEHADFYLASADDLPFEQKVFSVCLCILSLNFFPDIQKVLQEIKRVLVPGGAWICCVPIPERKPNKSPIKGRLYTQKELEGICAENDFKIEPFPYKNGALFYFRAVLRKYQT